MIRVTDARDLVLQAGHVERFNPAYTAAAGLISRPRYIEAVRASGYTGRATDVGVVSDLMIHDIDLVRQLAGRPVVDVQAVGGTVFGPHEDLAQARLQFANGCVANLSVSRTSFEPQRKMRIFTDELFLGIDFTTSTLQIVRPSERVRAAAARRATHDGRRAAAPAAEPVQRVPAAGDGPGRKTQRHPR